MNLARTMDMQLTEAGELALTDPLTGLGNLRRFQDKMARLIAERSDDPVPFAVCIIDLDGFKPINDLFGRHSGDDILIQVALRLRAAVGDGAVVVRTEGDAFGVLYPMVFNERAAREQGQMLIEILSAPYDVGERTVRLSVSVGISLYYSNEDNPDALITKAESALYNAKKAGRSRVTVYTQEMEDAAKRITRIEQALRRAVSAGEVEPHFQPIVDLSTRQTVGLECLARWTDRDLGAVPPGVFIPIAEERGIIAPLSQLLLRKATLAARNWPGQMFLSFNLSPAQLADPETAEQVLSILKQTDFDPHRLEIEITETGVMSDPQSAERIVHDLRKVGVRVSLDDFGTGQSSLGRLRDFSFDKLKIDRAFIASILDDQPTEHIVKAILAMCEGLGLGVIAEGIEEEAQADRLIQYGCVHGQGYFFGKPSTAESTLGYLHENHRGASRARSA